ncbi:MAG: hypothetical protein R3231_05405 [bacterium]|nr:hypothetical protein [bacterium]
MPLAYNLLHSLEKSSIDLINVRIAYRYAGTELVETTCFIAMTLKTILATLLALAMTVFAITHSVNRLGIARKASEDHLNRPLNLSVSLWTRP